MGNLTNQYISSSFDTLLQVETTGTVTDGLGVQPSNFIFTNVTASNISGNASGLSGVVSSSYATTASYALNGGSGGGGDTFPFTGDAQITGSLIVSGSFIPTGKSSLSAWNVIIGREAGEKVNASTVYNVFVGGRAGGGDNDFGDQNVLIGYEAGYLGNQTGNTSIGHNAGRGWGTTGVTPTTGYNTSIGYQSAYNAAGRSTETHNTSVGAFTARNLTAGSGNTLLGYYAGYNNLGDGNIIIGSGSVGVASMANQLRIGNGESVTVISASLATGDIIFPSTASAAYFSGDGSQLTNLPASSTFPFTGDAQITGSLIVSSSTVDFSKTTNVDVNQLRMVPNGTTNSRIQFSGSYSSSISLVTEDSGSIVFKGNTGGLFSIEDSKDGVLSATTDVSGNPILLVDANWNVYAGSPFTDPWLISSGSHNTTNVYSGSATTATQSINLLNGHYHYMSCSVDTLFTFTNPPVTDRHYEFNLELIKDATAATRSLTYTDTVLWPGDVGLTELTASGEVSIAKFQTRNGGSSWYGTIVGRDFK